MRKNLYSDLSADWKDPGGSTQDRFMTVIY